MKITAMDVHRKEFGHAVRGYREDEVDNFLDAVAHELDRMSSQIDALEARTREAEARTLNFEAERNTINNALLTAQRASDDVMEEAQSRGKEALEEAEKTAKEIIGTAKEDKKKVLLEIKRLKTAEAKYREKYLAHLKDAMAEVSEIKLPASIDIDDLVASEAADTEAQEPEVAKAENLPEPKPEPEPEAEPEPVAPKSPKRAAAQPFEPIPDPHPTFAEPAVPEVVEEPVVASVAEEGFGQWGEMEEEDDDLELIS